MAITIVAYHVGGLHMEESKEKKCIYCGKGILDGIQLSESDIIPDALTNKKIRYKCVCQIEHNSKFSNDFESTVINDLAYLRNRLGMFGKNKYLPKYDAKYEIGDMSIIKNNVTSREDLFNGRIASGHKNGEDIKFGIIENLKKFSTFDETKVIDIDVNNCEITENINFCLKTFFCNDALRLAAKVGYEWYCKKNQLSNYFPEYQDIVYYIENGVPVESNIVQIITNTELYDMLNNQIELAGHALSIVHSSDRNIYVLFSFFGLVIYKIKIRKALINFTNRKTVSFYGIRYDGSEIPNIDISLSTDYLQQTSANPCNAIVILKDYIIEKFKQILELQIFTLKNFKFVIDEICNMLKIENDEDKYNQLIGYHNERRMMALYVLFHLGKHKEKYSTTLDFNSNLKEIFQVNEKIKLNNETFGSLQQLYKDPCFIEDVREGIDIFNTAYEKECKL